jgi:hypothetical protein
MDLCVVDLARKHTIRPIRLVVGLEEYWVYNEKEIA